MTEEKFYSIERDGSYCLGFPNRHALSENEIEEIFSDFGNVISVRTSGDEKGFRFVRFKTLEEAESAIEGLKNHKKIRILPKKPKTPNHNDKSTVKEYPKNGQQKGFVCKRKGNFNNSNKNNVDDDMDDSSKDVDSSSVIPLNRTKPQPYGGIHHGSFQNKSEVSKNEENSTNVIETDSLMKLLRLRSMRGTVANNFSYDSSSNFDDEVSKTTCSKNNKIHDKDGKEAIDNFKPRQFNENFDTKKFDQESENSSHNIRQPAAHVISPCRPNHIASENASKIVKEQVTSNVPNDEEPPELVSTEELKQKSIKGSVCSDEIVHTKMAEEVIVANIPEKFSVLYILYLLEKFEPISVTEMKTIAHNGIRYCSVYFKSQKDAIAVEKKFDNFDLSGSKLIVRTPQLLVNEVGSD